MEIIVGVACKVGDLMLSLPAPNRHCDIMYRTFKFNRDLFLDKDTEQGFITSKARFVGRREGLILALKTGQVKEENLIAPPELFSEDLW